MNNSSSTMLLSYGSVQPHSTLFRYITTKNHVPNYHVMDFTNGLLGFQRMGFENLDQFVDFANGLCELQNHGF